MQITLVALDLTWKAMEFPRTVMPTGYSRWQQFSDYTYKGPMLTLSFVVTR